MVRKKRTKGLQIALNQLSREQRLIFSFGPLVSNLKLKENRKRKR